MAVRADGRENDQIRPLKITYGVYGNAQGSVLFEQGNTRVLCSVMLQDGVPHFLRGSKQGWLTAEYSLLPASTITRSAREASIMKRNSRSIEISRLIGRSLRAVIDLKQLGEKTIYIDCDVLQADGGTRTAAISGAYCALKHASEKWLKEGLIKESIIVDTLAGVSVGYSSGRILLDVNFQEDSRVDADFNFVMTGSGNLVEIQGATESFALPWESVLAMREVAFKGIQTILAFSQQQDEIGELLFSVDSQTETQL